MLGGNTLYTVYIHDYLSVCRYLRLGLTLRAVKHKDFIKEEQ